MRFSLRAGAGYDYCRTVICKLDVLLPYAVCSNVRQEIFMRSSISGAAGLYPDLDYRRKGLNLGKRTIERLCAFCVFFIFVYTYLIEFRL